MMTKLIPEPVCEECHIPMKLVCNTDRWYFECDCAKNHSNQGSWIVLWEDALARHVDFLDKANDRLEAENAALRQQLAEARTCSAAARGMLEEATKAV